MKTNYGTNWRFRRVERAHVQKSTFSIAVLHSNKEAMKGAESDQMTGLYGTALHPPTWHSVSLSARKTGRKEK